MYTIIGDDHMYTHLRSFYAQDASAALDQLEAEIESTPYYGIEGRYQHAVLMELHEAIYNELPTAAPRPAAPVTLERIAAAVALCGHTGRRAAELTLQIYALEQLRAAK